MIERTIESKLILSIGQWPITLLTGARQVGKSTLCYKISKEKGFNYVSLDDPMERATAVRDPVMFLKMHPAPLVIDEVQYAPQLFDFIEHEVNRRKLETGSNYGMYMLTGSQSYDLMQKVSQSMAGRINIMVMSPLSMREIRGDVELPFVPDVVSSRTYNMGPLDLYERMIRGFYPEMQVNHSKNTEEFYRNYVNTYLERDVTQIIGIRDRTAFTEFLSILASLTGQELVYETIASAVGVSPKTIKSWVGVLEAGHLIHLLKPYYDTSMVKRIVKHPKMYFADPGLACYLVGIHDSEVLSKSIYKGRMFETYVVDEILKSYSNNTLQCDFSYYRDSNGNEIDLLMMRDEVVMPIEIKSGISFDKKDVSSFKQLKAGSRKIANGCVICNTEVPYAVMEDVPALPVTSI